MATIRVILVIFCFTAFGRDTVPVGNILADDVQRRKHLLSYAQLQIGVREASGNNDGKAVEMYLQTVGLKKGPPWCAAFVSWVFQQAGYSKPRTAWSPALFGPKVKSKEIIPGNLFGIWMVPLNRIGHVGLIESRQGHWIMTIEGNTNLAGGREGDGVYRKRRAIKSIHQFSDWLPPLEVVP
ncbi:CHAP domain-containing protein [Pedobacter cryophilus]|uniref:CHAP domain-containing protein n=1 Tax=Pedobacter cryophilus TaxID=2571271 RepID=A0A4U1C0S6_9SPHI|nr:CHAP domain-containing protein [Pedobacter cryophilus]TKB98645.1 CHAP domain-containing protein [Pedobacter cryophilus]